MTNEEAIKMLKYNSNVIHQTMDGRTDPKEVEALDLAIQALEAQRNLTNEELYQSFIDLEAENERLHDALEAQPTDAVRLISLDDIMAHFPKANFNGDPIENKKAYPYWKTDITGLISILKSVPMVNPCEDAVSREAVKELVVKEFVNPQDGMEEWRNAVNDVVEEILHNIETMPSVIPQRKMGKWIWDLRMGLHKCSVCGKFCDFDYLYCPNCGSYNAENKENEND